MSTILTHPHSVNYTKPPMTKVLWVNAAPDTSFDAQSVSLSENAFNYDVIVVQFKAYTGTGTSGARNGFSYYWMNSNRSHGTFIQMCSGSNNRLGHRYWTVSDTGLSCSFNAAYYNGSSGNTYCIPQSIIGIKLGGLIS